MVIVDKDLLTEFRESGLCEYCRKRRAVDPHHLFGRGFGGGQRLDIRINLIALCRRDHQLFHDGKIKLDTLAGVVAKREGYDRDSMIDAIWLIRRLPKGTTAEQISKNFRPVAVSYIARKILAERNEAA